MAYGDLIPKCREKGQIPGNGIIKGQFACFCQVHGGRAGKLFGYRGDQVGGVGCCWRFRLNIRHAIAQAEKNLALLSDEDGRSGSGERAEPPDQPVNLLK